MTHIRPSSNGIQDEPQTPGNRSDEISENLSSERLIEQIFQPLLVPIRRVPIDTAEHERLTQAWSQMLHDLALIRLSPSEIIEAEICLQRFEDMLPTIGADVERGNRSSHDAQYENALGKSFAAQMNNCIKILRHDLGLIFQQVVLAIEAHKEPQVGQLPLPFFMDPKGKIEIGQGSPLNECVSRQAGIVDPHSIHVRRSDTNMNGAQLMKDAQDLNRGPEPLDRRVA